jgi:hypothetical protein
MKTFGNGTTGATVTAVTISMAGDAIDFTTLAAAIETAAPGRASTTSFAQVYDVTVTAGNLTGRFLIVNDAVDAISDGDTFVNVTGMTGALDPLDFQYS